MAALGVRALLSPRFPATCFSRCLGSSSMLGGRQTDLSAFRGSPALATHFSFNGGRRRLRVTAASMSTGAESAANNPGYCESPDAATKSYHVQQTIVLIVQDFGEPQYVVCCNKMYRIKDPKASLDFYSKVLGMTLIKRLDFEEAKFSLYFLGYESPESIPKAPAERTAFLFKCKATLELTHNWGTESDPNFKGYLSGISDPRGYGLIGITVDDVYKACERFENLGVEFAKRPDDGKMKGLAFIKDPDGYWIEIFDAFHMCEMVDGPSS